MGLRIAKIPMKSCKNEDFWKKVLKMFGGLEKSQYLCTRN